MKGPATELIHAGETDTSAPTPLTTPIYETTTFVFDNAQEVVAYNEGRSNKHLYSRYTNPTVVAAEKKLAALDRTEAALLFSSGQGATSTILLAHLKAGDEIVCGAAIYGGTLHLIEDVLARFGVIPRFVSLEQLADPASVIGERTRVVWFESPINPTLRCVDIAAVAKACRARGVLSVIDNTFACPINQQPLALGIDLAMQSVTKYLNGHSDVTGGMVSGSKALLAPIEKARRQVGTVMDPHPAYALGRGLKTLPLRVAQHNANARAVADFLAADARVSQVYYPGLTSHPDHAIATKQMTGFGGMVILRSRRPLRSRRARLRPSADRQARRQPRRHRKPDQHAGDHLAVGAQRRAAASRRRDQGHAAAVGRPRRRGRSDRGPRSGFRKLEDRS